MLIRMFCPLISRIALFTLIAAIPVGGLAEPENAAPPAAGPVPDPAIATVAAMPTSDANRNPVEPLSNGLRLAMTQGEIIAQFGEPTTHTFDARTFGYADFDVSCGGAQSKLWHLTLKHGVKLSSGIGVGSTRGDVQRVFGNASPATVGQYRLTFSYAGDRVVRIKIDPVNREFSDWAAAPSPSPDASQDQASRGAPPPASLLGIWYGAGDAKGTIELRPDGTYAWSGKPAGNYQVSGDNIVFTGSLAAWDQGRAKLNARRDAFEFYWTTPAGAKLWFAFIR
jgi:hypothetical protein